MIYVIGIGPGDKGGITLEALEALEACEIISGYEKYIELVKKFLPEKIFYSYHMRDEIKRCQEVLKISKETGKKIALISSGDSGVYGMAGLMLETAEGSGEEIYIISGVTASNSAAAILGAPLMNDYANISLSDLMTPWEVIAKKLKAACEGDFVICVYNPASHHRPENFKKACEILLNHKSPETPCGYVRNIGRDEKSHEIMTLKEIKDCEKIDMLTTVIIGNSQTYVLNDKLITPRGYKINHS